MNFVFWCVDIGLSLVKQNETKGIILLSDAGNEEVMHV